MKKKPGYHVNEHTNRDDISFSLLIIHLPTVHAINHGSLIDLEHVEITAGT